jgi:hypothetical protein
MANNLEFNQYSTNTKSILFDGFLTFNPHLPPVISPDFVIVLGSAGSTTWDTDGLLKMYDGTVDAAGTRKLFIDPDRIVKGTVRGTAPTTATAKVVDLQTINIDYAYANPAGISSIFVDGWEGRDTIRYKKDYVIQFPLSAGLTPAQRTARLITLINSDPTAKFSAAAITGASGSGSGVAGGGIRLTSKFPGQDYQVTAGEGFAPPTIVTPSAREFGTSLFLQRANIPAYTAAFTGKTFNTVSFTYRNPITLADHGLFIGRSVGNNAEAFQNVAVMILFEIGAADAQATTVSGVLAGTATPASKYNAKTAAITFA